MNIFKLTAAAAALAVSGTAIAAVPTLPEEAYARAEEKLIYSSPIAGIENNLWFDYIIDVAEAQKELKSDLRRASDIEDLRDAWEEYGSELAGERRHYVKEMAERGYRQGSVTVGG